MRRMTGGVRFFAMGGEGFSPSTTRREEGSRTRFAREAPPLGAFGAAGWFALDPIADAEWISDEMLVGIAHGVSWPVFAWSTALFPMLARRFHDAGIVGRVVGAGADPLRDAHPHPRAAHAPGAPCRARVASGRGAVLRLKSGGAFRAARNPLDLRSPNKTDNPEEGSPMTTKLDVKKDRL